VSRNPEHNIWSHGSDAFQQAGLAISTDAFAKPVSHQEDRDIPVGFEPVFSPVNDDPYDL